MKEGPYLLRPLDSEGRLLGQIVLDPLRPRLLLRYRCFQSSSDHRARKVRHVDGTRMLRFTHDSLSLNYLCL